MDLPTAFYITSAEVKDAEVVGQFAATGAAEEQFGLVLDKESRITGCVTAAVDALRKRRHPRRAGEEVAGRRRRASGAQVTYGEGVLKTPAAQDAADGGYVPSPRRIERERFKRARARRATAVAALSTLVTAVVLYLVITGSPGWPRTRETFFSAGLRPYGPPEGAGGAAAESAAAGGVRGGGAGARAAAGGGPDPARPGVLPAARPGHRLHRLLPRTAADHLSADGGLRGAGAAAARA